MMWVCPIGWQSFSIQLTRCPACGSDLAVVDRRSFNERLARALEDPEPQTAIRAARFLGSRVDTSEVVPVLVHALSRRWDDPFVAGAIVRALGRFQNAASHDALVQALRHESSIVRITAAECLHAEGRKAS